MQNTHVHINTISALHEFYRYGKPNHPLITVIELAELPEDRFQENAIYSTSFYGIFCKRIKGLMKYGKGNYDFDEGS